ncbi:MULTISPECIES: hypothetical protein [unclassified Crossiella]|uniref:hypothetical protein n=1 Tax=unclassified Crossiella TaxID=2620835 RepID=UPI001FFF6360|nr:MULTISPECIES: hypothetical protein [unclassified Crossiella]MCK2242046.1 hypothetical protein [Crossiella sp. S99.2]MCK2255949.1 hypothetical protein [Crossiella sp. S99.1]
MAFERSAAVIGAVGAVVAAVVGVFLTQAVLEPGGSSPSPTRVGSQLPLTSTTISRTSTTRPTTSSTRRSTTTTTRRTSTTTTCICP